MSDLLDVFRLALVLVSALDPELVGIVALSLKVSFAASALAFAIGAPAGALLCVVRFPGRQTLVVFVNALLGLPPVVIGLLVYILVSRSGPLGTLGLLFTPAAMILAQTLLALPIVVALTHTSCRSLWSDYGDALQTDGASRLRSAATLLAMARLSLVTVFLSAFGRSIAEVGAAFMVGGNIRGETRTMTTAIVLETSRGDFRMALALGLVLIVVSFLVSVVGLALGRLAAHA